MISTSCSRRVHDSENRDSVDQGTFGSRTLSLRSLAIFLVRSAIKVLVNQKMRSDTAKLDTSEAAAKILDAVMDEVIR